MKLKLLTLFLLFSLNLRGQGFYTDINLDTFNLYFFNGRVESSLDSGKVRLVEVNTFDTTILYLGILRVDTVDFPKYYPDANYFVEGDLTLMLRLSPEIGYKVGFQYFDKYWQPLKEEQIIFKLKK